MIDSRRMIEQAWREGQRQLCIEALNRNEYPARNWIQKFPDLARARWIGVCLLNHMRPQR